MFKLIKHVFVCILFRLALMLSRLIDKDTALASMSEMKIDFLIMFFNESDEDTKDKINDFISIINHYIEK